MVSVHNQARRNWFRLRFQLGGCLLLAAIVPGILRAAALPLPEATRFLSITFIGVVVAIVIATALYRSLAVYPGAEASAYILPAFSFGFGLLLAVFIIGRFDYNRWLLLVSYFISILWFYFLHTMQQRGLRLRLGALPFGGLDELAAQDRLSIRILPTPDADISDLDAIVVDLRHDLPEEWDRQLADYALSGMRVFHTKHLVEALTGRVELEHLSENNFGSLLPASAFMSLKHVVDWVLALLTLIVLAPIMLLIALAIRTTSPGPALFRQTRIGLLGRPFTVYKFRTMTTAPAVQDRAAAMTQSKDTRITRIGGFLRRSRIDELPQLINVLLGEMSWIGPRPEAEVLSRWYEQEIAFYRYRHIVRPGITGWAQVCQGHVADVHDVRSKLHYDFYYIKHFSLWLDLLIVARTIRTMVTGFGSK